MRSILVLGPLLLLAASAHADVAPDTPEDWRVEEPTSRVEGGALHMAFVVRNDGGALRLIVDPDTSVRRANGRFVEARATRVTVDGRELAIVETQRGPHTVRATEPFSVAANARARIAIEARGEGALDGTPSGVTVHEDGAWIGTQVRFGHDRSPVANQVESPVPSSGCGCRVGGARTSGLTALGMLVLAWARRRRQSAPAGC